MRIIWAIDAFEDNRELNKNMANFVRAIYNTTNADIEPLYLLRENEIIIPTYEVPSWVADHSNTAESLFSEVLADYTLPFLQKPKVIPHTSKSHAGAAQTLADYALKTHTDLIIVGSHGRKGLQRFLLGSFAESLLMQSEVPVCVISSEFRKTKNSNIILYPTEFGEHAKENYRHTLNLAKNMKAEILLLHAIERPIESLFDLNTRPRVYNYKGQMLTLEQIVENQIETMSRRAQLWIDWAQKAGVQAHYFIDSSFKPIDELILSAVQKHNADLIVMEAQSGPMGATLLGSLTRSVARKATCPVYVLPRHFYDHPEDRFQETPAP